MREPWREIREHLQKATMRIVIALGVAVASCAVALTASAATAPSDTLRAGEALSAGQQIFSPNTQYEVTMQSDGNLVEYLEGGRALWASRTSGATGAHAVMQRDGNLAIYATNGTAVWSSDSRTSRCPQLVLQNDGNLVIYARGPIWATNTVNSFLKPGDVLRPGWALYSPPPEDYELEMQANGNLALYDGAGTQLWATHTAGNPGAYAKMGKAGNLVVYSRDHKTLWATHTYKHPGAYLALLSNADLVVYQGSTPLWTSGTSGKGSGPSLAPKAPPAATCPVRRPPPPPAVPTPPVITVPVTTPVPTPPPSPPHKPRVLRVRLAISWTWDRAETRLRKVKVGTFPGKTRLWVKCKGRGCPRHLKGTTVSGPRRVRRMLHSLWGGHYREGDELFVSLLAPGWHAERAEITMRWGRLPKVNLIRK